MKLLRKLILIISVILLTFSTTYAKIETSQNINLNLTIAEYVELKLPDSIYMDVKVGVDESVEADVFLRTNCNINLIIESAGFSEENANILNEYVQYELADFFIKEKASLKYGPFKVEPGTMYQGKFRVNWLGESFADGEWQNVTTGNYQDTITVTISY